MIALGGHIFAGAFDFCPFTSPAGIHIKYFTSVGHLGGTFGFCHNIQYTWVLNLSFRFCFLRLQNNSKAPKLIRVNYKLIQDFVLLVRGLNTLMFLA